MPDIEKILEQTHANTDPSIQALPQEWHHFITKYQALYTKVQQAKGDGSELNCLLGITTKAHITSTQLISESLQSRQAMQEVLVDSIGEKYATKFSQSDVRQLVFETHLWLYLQGYCQLDFSLANDYAQQTAQLISQLNNQETDHYRCEFLKSFYLGKERAPKQRSLIGQLFQQLKCLVSSKLTVN